MKNKLHSLPHFWKVVICALVVLSTPLWIIPLLIGSFIWLLLDMTCDVIFDHGISEDKPMRDGYETFCEDMWGGKE